MTLFSRHDILARAILPDHKVPEATVTRPAVTIYSQDFNDPAAGIDGWTANASNVVASWTDLLPHSAPGVMAHRTTQTGGGGISRAFTGLTVGRSYTFRTWLRAGAPGNLTWRIEVNGITPPAATAAEVNWTERTYTFTATATTHTISLIVVAPSNAGWLGYWDDMTLTRNSYIETIPEHMEPTPPLALRIEAASVTMDDSWAPYIQASLTIPLPPMASLDALDPRAGVRVELELTQRFEDWNATGYRPPITRLFDLLLVARTDDLNAATSSLTLESDEALLRNFGLVSTTPERVTGLSIKTAVTYALAKIGATLAPGAADANIAPKPTLPFLTNLAGNSAARVTAAGWSGSNSTISRLTGLVIPELPGVTTAVRGTQIAAGNGGLYLTSDTAAPFLTVVAGQQYRITAWVRASVDKTVQLSAQWANGTGTTVGSSASSAFSLLAGVWTKISATFTAPAGAVRMGPYSYSNVAWAVGNTYDLTGLMVTTSANHPAFYFDGSTTDTVEYDYGWTGAANASTSTATWIPNSDAMIWEPGASAWDYVAPLVEAGNLRLYCDAQRVWRLEPSGTPRDGLIKIGAGQNATEAADTISLTDSAEWFTGVVITYRWTDSENVSHLERDAAGTGEKVLFIEYNRPYPGPGAAQAILRRAEGRGRVFRLEAMSDYLAEPGKSLIASVPNTPIQSGYVTSVSWRFPEARMTVASRALTDTPATSWLLAAGTWAAQTKTWANYTA